MSNKFKKIAYTLIALIVLFCMLVSDSVSVFAKSYNQLYSSGWHFYQYDDGWKMSTEAQSFSNCDDYFPGFPVSQAKTYIENYSVSQTLTGDVNLCTLSSDSEIVVAVDPDKGTVYKLSKDPIYCLHNQYNLLNSEVVYTSSVYSSGSTDSNYLYGVTDVTQFNTDTFLAFYTGSMKCFDSYDSAVNYLNTGSIDGLLWQGSETNGYDGNGVYLDDFKMIVHDSNAYSAYYLEFRYSIPEQLQGAADLKLQINETYELTTSSVVSAVRTPHQHLGVDYIDINEHPTGFKLYLDDITAIQNYLKEFDLTSFGGDGILKRRVLGSEKLIDFSVLSSSVEEKVYKITNSKLYLNCYVLANGTCGKEYDGDVDFISGANSMSSYTPDSDGNMTYNNDYTSNGYYETEVGTDGAGNTTYNYYYYGDDNSKHSISAKDSYNNTYTDNPDGSGDGGGASASGGSVNVTNNPTFTNYNNITVEGDQIDNDINNIIENDTTTKEDNDSFIDKFLGFFDLLKNNNFVIVLSKMFAWLPGDVFTVLCSSIGIIAGVAVIRFFRK